MAETPCCGPVPWGIWGMSGSTRGGAWGADAAGADRRHHQHHLCHHRSLAGGGDAAAADHRPDDAGIGPALDQRLPAEAGSVERARRGQGLEPHERVQGSGKLGPLCRFHRRRDRLESGAGRRADRQDVSAAGGEPLGDRARDRLFGAPGLEAPVARVCSAHADARRADHELSAQPVADAVPGRATPHGDDRAEIPLLFLLRHLFRRREEEGPARGDRADAGAARHLLGLLLRERPLSSGLAHHRHAALRERHQPASSCSRSATWPSSRWRATRCAT